MSSDPNEQWGVVEIRRSLVGRKAGASAIEKAKEEAKAHPVRTVWDGLRGAKPDARNWLMGGIGEKATALHLRRLPEGWRVFHDIPVGNKGTNIDHLVVGLGGVFSVNTKHLTGKVTIEEDAVLVNGRRRPFLKASRSEAAKAGRLLARVVGHPVDVRSVLALAVDQIVTRGEPADVKLLRIAALPRWLREQPVVLSPAEVIALAAAASKLSTWSPTLGAGDACVCGAGTLVRRRNRRSGSTFLGCSTYPKCHHTQAEPAGT